MHATPKTYALRPLSALIFAAFISPVVYAEYTLPSIDVVGDEQGDIGKIPGSIAVVNRQEIDRIQPQSTEDVLKIVAGISIKPEEESAIVANIGVRGLSAGDYYSLILEDGVPVAPGLFVGNGRYYNPRIQRMDSIEVLKGGASLRYGPSTIGGVINYKTKMPQEGLSLSGRVGSFGYKEANLEAGVNAQSGNAIGGIFYTEAHSDGFLDKGFKMRDLMVKGGIAIGDQQWLALKATHYNNDANISYRGHFLDAYRAKADFNPAADDWFLTQRNSLDLNHIWTISDHITLKSVLYWSEINRDYWRYNTVSGAPTKQVNGLTQWNYSNTLNGNNRAFDRIGAETRLTIAHDSLGISHETELGLRLMKEEMHDQTIAATRANPRSGTISSNRIDKASSIAFFAQNRFALSQQLAITPGLRIENYTQSRLDLRRTPANGNRAETRNTEYIPGLGFTFNATPTMQLFGGIHKAFAPALNGDAIVINPTLGPVDQQLDAQRSVNYELGLRGQAAKMRYEVTAFRMDFQNQVIPANSNSNFQNTNGGKTLHQGLELSLGYAFNNGFSIDANTTYVPDAHFVGHRYDKTGKLTIADGNRIAYTPKWIANLTLAYRVGSLNTALTINHTGAQFSDTANSKEIKENTSGFFTGEIAGYTTANLSASYAINKQLSLFGSIKNLTNERYISGLRQGIYIGPERSFELGGKYTF
ncbi:TonB-dependent receptor domain-containing protein [Chitinibacter sp. GC72]|uniref:TonB-dependent receptor family protein n=1 Tax=Chitinibacter sp. GC72 TaxID=1526917 RepID=UPI0012FA5357|nr:TonB-dependent receptor [Chitinibacter sp. GC72]